MIVTARAMKEYRDALSKISGKAAEDMQNYIMAHGYNINDDFLDYAYALATKYGEASSALACEFYDELSSYWARPEVAEPAKTATYGEVAKTVNGTALYSFDLIPQSVGRLVKMSAEDTVLHNAIRDGAYFAWIPSGDTCPFCIMLASNGWQKASGKALKNGHAEHIHANCDCTYAIRFDDSMDYEGYDPDEYFDKYNNASDSYDWKEKLNAMRRENYESKKELINAQKREAYARRQQLKAEEE